MSFVWIILAFVVGLIIVIVGTSHDTKKRIKKQDAFIKEEEAKGVILSAKTDIENGIIAIDKQREVVVYIDDKTQSNIIKKRISVC